MMMMMMMTMIMMMINKIICILKIQSLVKKNKFCFH